MKKILYAWEFGGDLGHVSVVLPLAKQWRAQGTEVIFAIPKFSKNIQTVEKIITENGFQSIAAPGSGDFSATNREIKNHLQLLESLSAFQNSGVVSFYLKTWLDIYHLIEPDAVVCDFALCAQLACRIAGIPAVAMDLGFFSPDSRTAIPDFIDPEQRYDVEQDASITPLWQTLKARINAALAPLTDIRIEQLADLYSCQYEMVLNYPELAAFNQRDRAVFLGAIVDVENDKPKVDWPDYSVTKPRVFAYLKLGYVQTRTILDALVADENKSVVIYIPACPDKIKEFYTRKHVAIYTSPVDVQHLLQKASLVVAHAGVGMITQSLLSGVPLFLYPVFKEQVLNASRVVSLGAGDMLRSTDDAGIQAQMAHLLEESYFTRNARAFAMRNKPADIVNIIDKINENTQPQYVDAAKCHYLSLAKKEQVNFSDYDVVFLSYDEVNADHNWHALKQMVPNAIRVHGVKGFDAAHKAAAAAANTERFILVDADNLVDKSFFEIKTQVPFHMHHSVWQWCSQNNVTGLRYPFGGVKIWTRELINSMKSHEACDDGDDRMKTDFWEQPSYNTFYRVFSTNVTNASPYHSFRAGYREAVKLGSCAGRIKHAEQYKPGCMYNPDIRRAGVWMSCGAEVENGLWSILGARQGFIDYLSAENNMEDINNYDWFMEYWMRIYAEHVSQAERQASDWGRRLGSVHSNTLFTGIVEQGNKIREITPNIKLLDMDADQSVQFKAALDEKYDRSISLFHSFHVMDGR